MPVRIPDMDGGLLEAGLRLMERGEVQIEVPGRVADADAKARAAALAIGTIEPWALRTPRRAHRFV